MAKKSSGSMGGVIFIVMISGIVAAYEWAQRNWQILSVAASVLLGLFIWSQARKRKRYDKWAQSLHEKYGDAKVVEGILNKEFWKGMTKEQLNDSLGEPSAVDVQALKTKHKEIWKYQEVKKGQYALRITLDNHEVVSWDQKS
ncbi:DUF2845 domain-containing protein [Zoogloea oleivorans]|uniref:DUF2845 domain-containing protein n=1 Tax=Zoogloea oleivorans TaxID=1552750 RepID=A0A6C2D1Z2_9RHOO|nr:DUF2845 domain-containing protein [Zoogloea oleivorans]TYC59699.1 DUF2845 domain-containing protein [Zoogloea oleivorans]